MSPLPFRKDWSQCVVGDTAKQLQVHIKKKPHWSLRMRRNIVFDNRITPPVNEMWCMCGYGSSTLRSAVFSLLAQSYHNGPLKRKQRRRLSTGRGTVRRLFCFKCGGGSRERAAAQQSVGVNGSWIQTWWRPDSGGWGSGAVGPDDKQTPSVNCVLLSR